MLSPLWQKIYSSTEASAASANNWPTSQHRRVFPFFYCLLLLHTGRKMWKTKMRFSENNLSFRLIYDYCFYMQYTSTPRESLGCCTHVLYEDIRGLIVSLTKRKTRARDQQKRPAIIFDPFSFRFPSVPGSSSGCRLFAIHRVGWHLAILFSLKILSLLVWLFLRAAVRTINHHCGGRFPMNNTQSGRDAPQVRIQIHHFCSSISCSWSFGSFIFWK